MEGRSIGAIRIHDKTTQVEIATEVADLFEKNSAHAGPDDVRFKPIEGPTIAPYRGGGGKPPRPAYGKPPRRIRARED